MIKLWITYKTFKEGKETLMQRYKRRMAIEFYRQTDVASETQD